MKILFVTGDYNCECEGTGILQRTVKEPPDFDPDRERAKEKGDVSGERSDDDITINVLCDCVKAMDATLEKFHDEYDTDITEGRIVPDKD